MRGNCARRDEANSALLSENQELKQQIASYKGQQMKLQQQKDAQRQAHMTNPYHAGFSSLDDEGRDPFGGALKGKKSMGQSQ